MVSVVQAPVLAEQPPIAAFAEAVVQVHTSPVLTGASQPGLRSDGGLGAPGHGVGTGETVRPL